MKDEDNQSENNVSIEGMDRYCEYMQAKEELKMLDPEQEAQDNQLERDKFEHLNCRTGQQTHLVKQEGEQFGLTIEKFQMVEMGDLESQRQLNEYQREWKANQEPVKVIDAHKLKETHLDHENSKLKKELQQERVKNITLNFMMRKMEDIKEEIKELKDQVATLTSKVEELKKTEKEPEAP